MSDRVKSLFHENRTKSEVKEEKNLINQDQDNKPAPAIKLTKDDNASNKFQDRQIVIVPGSLIIVSKQCCIEYNMHCINSWKKNRLLCSNKMTFLNN